MPIISMVFSSLAISTTNVSANTFPSKTSAVAEQPSWGEGVLHNLQETLNKIPPNIASFKNSINSLPLPSINLTQTTNCPLDGDLVVSANCILSAGTYTYNSITVKSGATLYLVGDPLTGSGVVINVEQITVEPGGFISSDKTG